MSRALVVVEHGGGAVSRASLEALSRVRALGLEAVAFVAGEDPGPAAERAAPWADEVLAARHELLEHLNVDVHVPLLERLVSELGATMVLGPATHTGRDLLARLAARLAAPYAAEITGLDLDGEGRPTMVRSMHGGKVSAELAFAGDPPFLATVRANAFELERSGAEAPIRNVAPEVDESAVRSRVTASESTSAGRVPLTEAQVVVTGGRGLGGPEAFELLERLADGLGAAVGASRAVVDAGWRDVSEQVGKSGNTVAPRLYVAFGVSGAVHHVMGMAAASTVVVVNKDPEAHFFRHADHGLAADALEVLPMLLERLER
jgi:electron transfer flavoprotein alpha subunit